MVVFVRLWIKVWNETQEYLLAVRPCGVSGFWACEEYYGIAIHLAEVCF